MMYVAMSALVMNMKSEKIMIFFTFVINLASPSPALDGNRALMAWVSLLYIFSETTYEESIKVSETAPLPLM